MTTPFYAPKVNPQAKLAALQKRLSPPARRHCVCPGHRKAREPHDGPVAPGQRSGLCCAATLDHVEPPGWGGSRSEKWEGLGFEDGGTVVYSRRFYDILRYCNYFDLWFCDVL